MKDKRLLIVDDHRLIFEGLRKSLGDCELHHASSAKDARLLYPAQDFYAYILDITLGAESGFDLARDLIRSGSRVFFLSMHDTPMFIRRAVTIGARGYFLKDEDLSLLLEALDNPGARPFWLTERGTNQLNRHIEHTETLYELLTQREQQIFRMLAEGMNYKEIAVDLGISAKTVNVHKAQLMAKLRLFSQNDLFRLAVKLEIISV